MLRDAHGLIVGVFSCSIFLSEMERDDILLLSVPQSVPETLAANDAKKFDAAAVRAGPLLLATAIPQA
jgi:hypothetical protein